MSWLEQFRALNWADAGLAAAGAYVLGCFTTGYYLVRAWRGQDIRSLESGNLGARNVGRVLGWTGFLITTLGDGLKGLLAVWAARRIFDDERYATIALLAVVVGHVWPAQLAFRGGKGVATSLGALLIYDWRLAAAYAVVFAGGWPLVRRTTLPGLFAFLCLPAADYWLHRDYFRVIGLALLAVVVLFAHRKNLAEEIPLLNARLRDSSKSE